MISNCKVWPKFIIPDHTYNAAVLVAFSEQKGTVVTVLDYAQMFMPKDIPIADWREKVIKYPEK